ncbi:hypothetical protein J3F83DRAFT_724020 [Trichoderma novae-zelandiae]
MIHIGLLDAAYCAGLPFLPPREEANHVLAAALDAVKRRIVSLHSPDFVGAKASLFMNHSAKIIWLTVDSSAILYFYIFTLSKRQPNDRLVNVKLRLMHLPSLHSFRDNCPFVVRTQYHEKIMLQVL